MSKKEEYREDRVIHSVQFKNGQVEYASRAQNQSIRFAHGDLEVINELKEMLGMTKSQVLRNALYMFYGAMKATSRDSFRIPHARPPVIVRSEPKPQPRSPKSRVEGDIRYVVCAGCGEEFPQPRRGGRPLRRCEKCR